MSTAIDIYNDLASEYERNADLVRPHIERVIQPFVDLLPQKGKILDVGCGVGIATELLTQAGFDVTGIDASPQMVSFAQKRNPKTRILIGDFRNIEIADGFDGIVMQAFIHLFPSEETRAILGKARELLRD